MKKLFLLPLLMFPLSLFANRALDKTQALHAEVNNNANPNIRQETHPILWAMVQDLADKAHVSMPRYISLHGAQKLCVGTNGYMVKKPDYILAWVDIWGDLYICHELVAELSYEEVEGIIAIAIAQKALWIPFKLAAVGITTGWIAAGIAQALFDRIPKNTIHNGAYITNEMESLEFLIGAATIPAAFAIKLASNYLQKCSDLNALELTKTENIIEGIKGRAMVEEGYCKESVFYRILNLLYLKKAWNFFTYPIRGYTDEERIAYLKAHME